LAVIVGFSRRHAIDPIPRPMENPIMKTVEETTVDSDTEAILEMLATGKPIPAEVRDRVWAEARRLSEELRKTHGVQEISAQLIRESRDEA
jgi:hypothetical protein